MIKHEQRTQKQRQQFERRGYRMGFASNYDDGRADYNSGPYDGASYNNGPYLSDQPYQNTAPAAPQLGII